MNNSYKILVLMPCYNDWQSAENIINEFKSNVINESIGFVIVNDNSSATDSFKNHENIVIINLNNNYGHQKALSAGLCFVYENFNFEKLILMDSDEQDNPKDAINALSSFDNNNIDLILFEREKRSENLFFKLFYYLYILCLKLFAGLSLRSGNFSIMNSNVLSKIVFNPFIMYHISATLQAQKINILRIPILRKKRTIGKSKMKFESLVTYGLNALTVNSGKIASRLFIFSGFMFLSSIIGLLIVILIKLLTNYAIAGWASTISLILIILIVFSVISTGIALLIHFFSKTEINLPPIKIYQNFIKSVQNGK